MVNIQRRVRAALTNDRGFTLIELLVVVIILGVVAAISVVSVSGAMKSAIAKSCKADWQSVDSAMSSYRTDNPLPAYPFSTNYPYLGKTYRSAQLYRSDLGTMEKTSLAGLGYISPLINNRASSYTIILLLDLPTDVAGYTIHVQGAGTKFTAPFAQTTIEACDNLGNN